MAANSKSPIPGLEIDVDTGLNALNFLQNQLTSRKSTRSALGLGLQLTHIQEQINNTEARARNGQVWKLNHALRPITALTFVSRAAVERNLRRLKAVARKGGSGSGADETRELSDPMKMVREDEEWEVHQYFPRTVYEFKMLQYYPERVRSLLDYYDVVVYRVSDLRTKVSLDPDDKTRDVRANLESCMEELAISFGLNWVRINGLVLPGSDVVTRVNTF